MPTVDSIYLVVDISMPLLNQLSMLTPVEIGPSNASPGKQKKKNARSK